MQHDKLNLLYYGDMRVLINSYFEKKAKITRCEGYIYKSNLLRYTDPNVYRLNRPSRHPTVVHKSKTISCVVVTCAQVCGITYMCVTKGPVMVDCVRSCFPTYSNPKSHK